MFVQLECLNVHKFLTGAKINEDISNLNINQN